MPIDTLVTQRNYAQKVCQFVMLRKKVLVLQKKCGFISFCSQYILNPLLFAPMIEHCLIRKYHRSEMQADDVN